jgi:hypothetical protein
MCKKLFLEVLFPDEVQPDDLELLRLPTQQRPGRARLLKAKMGEPDPNAPNSKPVFSGTGAKFGFVANADLLETPYTFTYQLVGEVAQ